ncbi:hypothetical protein TREMEDRAFT_58456 [Tremella mesenterica DSM 1558]|uniref:uncharacterized protein n=1 Tax=Tremella mesenterica (strain ATCC 24925 / CBS 8224 / DSM 1558 / NBRC 9311 / NRRL Y-6157 / RJB 2259-6 / UBC 559-6) TaxID=578456 RepID=UPI0003F49480|nr:uncharacterized protein TREMEDRAFT_58456 [Tremella mesenterica DSM 1558]EIW72293.1 hypothetical protein TREMEDRAFT_58456 [Tremella mesenterica DSM 1558]
MELTMSSDRINTETEEAKSLHGELLSIVNTLVSAGYTKDFSPADKERMAGDLGLSKPDGDAMWDAISTVQWTSDRGATIFQTYQEERYFEKARWLFFDELYRELLRWDAGNIVPPGKGSLDLGSRPTRHTDLLTRYKNQQSPAIESNYDRIRRESEETR